MSAAQPAVVVRPATRADESALGRLGALLGRTHHELDPAHSIPATPRTARGANAGSVSSRAKLLSQGQTSWEKCRQKHRASPLGTGTRTLGKARG